MKNDISDITLVKFFPPALSLSTHQVVTVRDPDRRLADPFSATRTPGRNRSQLNPRVAEPSLLLSSMQACQDLTRMALS